MGQHVELFTCLKSLVFNSLHGINFRIFLSSAVFFFLNISKISLRNTICVKQLLFRKGRMPGPDVLLSLICIQIVCKGYQQMTLEVRCYTNMCWYTLRPQVKYMV